MRHNVFVYGSLRHDDVVARVVGRVPPTTDASLPHHELVTVTGEVYPTIRRRQGATVPGRVLLDLRPSELARLDAFEGDDYLRRHVPVRTTPVHTTPGPTTEVAATSLVAGAYVHRAAASMAPTPWRYEEFLTTGLARFLATYRGFGRLAC